MLKNENIKEEQNKRNTIISFRGCNSVHNIDYAMFQYADLS